jgi:hypothetical protein
LITTSGVKMVSHDLFPSAAAVETTLDKLQKIPPRILDKGGHRGGGRDRGRHHPAEPIEDKQVRARAARHSSAGLIFFNWIYHRNEPKFLTPLVNRIAPFFPAAGAYETKQAGTPVIDDKKK